jgi:DNA-binding GntR family transcriptional regulator
LRDAIADDIRDRIISGAIKPGRRVREDEVAADHGVSRVPVREALQKLETEGYLTLVPYRGAVVTTPSPQKALAAMQVRRGLEVMAARLAAANQGGGAAKRLSRVVEQGRRAIELGRLNRLPELVTTFHELVAEAAGNQELADLLALYRGKVEWMFSVDLERRAEGEWADHAAVLDAILAGDEERAASLMDAHVHKDEIDCARLPAPASSAEPA